MKAQLDLAAFGLEEMDGAAMMGVAGGDLLPTWFYDPLIKVATALAICIVNSSDDLIDGATAGWNAAS